MKQQDPQIQATSQADSEATPGAKPARRTLLRRLLSHHELATLLLLLHAPIDAHAKPEIPLLKEAGLVEQVQDDAGDSRIRLTKEGNAVLQGLGLTR